MSDIATKLTTIANNTPAVAEAVNAAKATATGKVVRVDDVLTTEHPLQVQTSAGAKVTVSGKNLIPFPYKETSRTVNGITFTVNDDGSLHYEGTTPEGRTAQFHFTDYNKQLLLTPGETYTISVHADSNGAESTYTSLLNVNYKPVDKNPAAWSGSILDIAYIGKDGTPGSKTVVYPEDGTGGIQCYIHIPAGKTVNNTVRVMIEHGTAATEYERYKEPQTATAGADGKVVGLTSVSPSMTLIADSGAAALECTYFPASAADVYAKYQKLQQEQITLQNKLQGHKEESV